MCAIGGMPDKLCAYSLLMRANKLEIMLSRDVWPHQEINNGNRDALRTSNLKLLLYSRVSYHYSLTVVL